MRRLSHWVGPVAAGLALLAAYGFVCWILLARPANAHEAPTGWSYPFSCCSGYDCRPVPEAWVREENGGFTIARTGETIAYGDPRLKESPDGLMHWCSVAGADDGRTICLYVPPRSY